MARLTRTFEGRLLLVVLAGLAVRVTYTVLNRRYGVQGDALTFHLDAAHLADGNGFQRAFEAEPTAEHPPLHIILLAGLDLLGVDGFLGQKLVLCGVGSLTVGALGLLGRAVAGPAVGLTAAAIGAVYPLLWIIDGSLMSETPYALLITLVLLVAYGYRSKPTVRAAALLGAAIAAATLTRGEAPALLVLLALPLALTAQSSWRERARSLAVVGGVFLVIMAPWTVRNLLTFETPFLVSTNGDNVWVGANCGPTYYGDLVGSWAFSCFGKTRAPGDESQYSRDFRDRGISYARAHANRIPVVVGARLLRQWDLYRPAQSVLLQSFEGRHPRVAKLGLGCYWVLAAFALAGLVLLRRRRRPLLILVAPLVMATVVGAVIYGSTRLRVAAEPALVVLAAVAVDALRQRVIVLARDRRGKRPSVTA